VQIYSLESIITFHVNLYLRVGIPPEIVEYNFGLVSLTKNKSYNWMDQTSSPVSGIGILNPKGPLQAVTIQRISFPVNIYIPFISFNYDLAQNSIIDYA